MRQPELQGTILGQTLGALPPQVPAADAKASRQAATGFVATSMRRMSPSIPAAAPVSEALWPTMLEARQP
jgi:hypothetical protein